MKRLTRTPTAIKVAATGTLRMALRLALLLALLAGPAMTVPTHAAGIPVIDTANLSQTVISSIEAVAQTLKQIQQYQTQLQQYENMLQNTLAPAAYIWDAATSTMNQLRSAIDTLNYYKTHLGSIDAYLGKFQFIEYSSESVPGKIEHVRRREDGGYERLLLDEPRARYEYRFEYQRGVVDYKIRMIQDAIVDRQTGKPAATDTRYLRYPAWLDSLWLKFFGIQGGGCENKPSRRPLFGIAFTGNQDKS